MTRQTGPARLDQSPAVRTATRLPRRPRPLDPWTLAALDALRAHFAARHGDSAAVTAARRATLAQALADGGAR